MDVDNDLISRADLKRDPITAPLSTQQPLLGPSHVGTVKTRSTPMGHDSFAALVPAVRARNFNYPRPASAAKPVTSAEKLDTSAAKLVTPVAKPASSAAKPIAPVTPVPKSVVATPESIPTITNDPISVNKNTPMTAKATEPLVFDRVLGFDKWTMMHAPENERPALELSPTAKHVSRVKERESYRFNWRSRAAYNENKVASQPNIESNEHSEDNMRQLEACLSEIHILAGTHDVSQDSSQSLTRDETGYSNGHQNGCSAAADMSQASASLPARDVASHVSAVSDVAIYDTRGSNDALDSISNDDGHSNGSLNSLVTCRRQPHLTGYFPVFPVSPEDSVHIVRLTQDFYDSLIAVYQAASQEKAQFLKDKDDSQQKITRLENWIKDLEGTGRNGTIEEKFQDRTEDLQREATKLAHTENDEVQKLRVLVETYKSQQSIMNTDLRDKDRRLHKMESNISAMQTLLVNAHENGNEVCAVYRQKEIDLRKMEKKIQDMQATLTKAREQDQKHEKDQQGDQRAKGLVKEIFKRDREIEDLKTSLAAAKASSTLGQYMMTAERDALLRTQKHTNEHVTRVKNLTETLEQRENLYKSQTQKVESLLQSVESLNVINDDLSTKLKELQKNSPTQDMIDAFEVNLMAKTAEASSLQDELWDTRKRLYSTQAASIKATYNGKGLRGAAHLVSPSANAKLQTTVFSCIDCYVKNLACDNGTTCQNCVVSDTKCSRWRCSLIHVLKSCPLDRPCQLVHDDDGWLITKEPRPQW